MYIFINNTENRIQIPMDKKKTKQQRNKNVFRKMPNHWLEFQPMCFKIFFITKQNKVKESNKTPSNFIWLFLRRKEN